MKHAARGVSLLLVLACTTITFGLGVLQKTPCADGTRWDQTQPQYRLLCYTDIVPLAGLEQLADNRLPYLDACRPGEPHHCDEYPVLTMYLMRVAAWVGGTSTQGFFAANAALLGLCALVTAYVLWRLAGRRALWFALSPTLLLAGTVNWDLFAVMLATAALLAYATLRDEWAGGLLGLGAAAKFYPALFVVPLFAQGLHERSPDRSVRVLWWSAGAWLATNLPFAIAESSRSAWWEFFAFNATRVADWDSVWYVACQRHLWCPSTRLAGIASALVFVGGVAGLWWWKARREPGFAPWTLGLPILVTFLIANKVYSPQYSLWLLPWFVLAGTGFRLFVAFELVDVAVFLTRFRYFATLDDKPWGWPEAWYHAALLGRWVVLVLIVLQWVRRKTEPLEIVMGPRRDVVPARAAPAAEVV